MNDVYILFIRVSQKKRIVIGSLGRIAFRRGTYLYIGRAKINLFARIARHYGKKKRLFWHIDYLLSRKEVEIKEVWVGSGLVECELAKKISLLPSSRLAQGGFGSSDCRCPGHLFYTNKESKVRALLKELVFEKYVIGEVIGVCASKRKEEPKKNIGRGYLKKGYGLIGDAHFGTEKEVSFLAIEDVKRKELPFLFRPGNFAENITTRGIDILSLPLRTRLKVGKTILEVSQIGKGKGPHAYSYRGYSLLPKYGVFCKVRKSGQIEVGDNIWVIRE